MIASTRPVAAAAQVGVVLERLPALDQQRPIDVAERFRALPGLALLESARPGRHGRWSYLTADPVHVLEVPASGAGVDRAEANPGGIPGGHEVLAEARRLVSRLDPGLPDGQRSATQDQPPFLGGLVGYLGYDFGRRLERIPEQAIADQAMPDVHLALHDWAIAWDRRSGLAYLAGRALDGDRRGLEARLAEVRRTCAAAALEPSLEQPLDAAGLGQLRFRSGLSRSAFEAGVEAIREAIAHGDIYQANLTRRLEAAFDGDPWPLFRSLRTGDPSLMAAYLVLGTEVMSASDPGRSRGPRALLSASPEPFLTVSADGRVSSDPIKGTRPRGQTRDEDRGLARELLASGKDQAENVMIVDVLRNDLGRVCVPGTVRVPRLCRLERTAAVQHLVTTVTGQLRPDRDAFDLLAAAFPGGSITGAPKIRAMELLETLEPVRRGPYTGAAGWIGPDGAMATSILIRTFVADGRRLTIHVGGGITWRSDPAAEWDETVAKVRGPLGAIGARELA